MQRDKELMSYSEVARQMGIHTSRVVQLEQSAFKKMRRYLAAKGLTLADILPSAPVLEVSRTILDELPSFNYTDTKQPDAE